MLGSAHLELEPEDLSFAHRATLRRPTLNKDPLKRKQFDDRLMLQAALEEGLVVSDSEVQQNILNDSYFQDDEGNFDRTKYERYLGAKPAQEQKRLRKNIVDRLLVGKGNLEGISPA